jgi:hypothetical protein
VPRLRWRMTNPWRAPAQAPGHGSVLFGNACRVVAPTTTAPPSVRSPQAREGA